MRYFIKTLFLGLLAFSISQCGTTIKLENEAPVTFREVYIQNWISGVKGGGSGTNIFIEVNSKDIVLDSVFFRNDIAKLETKPMSPMLFIGRFKTDINTEPLSISENVSEKHSQKEFPFKLKDTECVVSYNMEGKTKFFKLTNIIEKQQDELPMSSGLKKENNLKN